MPLPSLIGIYSPAPQCGKSTVARHLWERYGYVRVPFAETLKDMVRIMLDDMGISTNKIHAMEQGDKSGEVHPDFPGLTLRRLYQTIGTEWGRNTIDQQIWIKIWKLKARNYFKSGARIVVEDVRFPNELEAVDALDGQMWGVFRASSIGAYHSTHASESMSVPLGNFDHYFMNDETIDSLLSEVDNIMQQYKDTP